MSTDDSTSTAEQARVIVALREALERRVTCPLVRIGTRVYVRSAKSMGTVVGADGVDADLLAVRLDDPTPSEFRDGWCAAMPSECEVRDA